MQKYNLLSEVRKKKYHNYTTGIYVYPNRLARNLSSPNVLDYIELSDAYGIIEVPAPVSWIGKSLKNLNVRAQLGVNIIAVENGNKTNVSPAAEYLICQGDVMVVLGDNYALEAVQKL